MSTQSKVQHTPGPWTIGPEDTSVGHLIYVPIKFKHRVGAISAEEIRANARLIAAAPELLEALVMIHRVMIQRNMAEDEREVANKAWAAIAKARGEETRS